MVAEFRLFGGALAVTKFNQFQNTHFQTEFHSQGENFYRPLWGQEQKYHFPMLSYYRNGANNAIKIQHIIIILYFIASVWMLVCHIRAGCDFAP